MLKALKTAICAVSVAATITAMTTTPSSAGQVRVYLKAYHGFYLQVAKNRLTNKFIDLRAKYKRSGGNCHRRGKIKIRRVYDQQYNGFTGRWVSQWIACTIIR